MPNNKGSIPSKANDKSTVAGKSTGTTSTSNEANVFNSLRGQISQALKQELKLLIREQVCLLTLSYQQDVAALKAEIVELKTSQEFICNKYDELKNDYERLTNENKEQKVDFEKKAASEATKLDSIEQYGRGQNLEFKGVSQIEGEDLTK